MTELSKAGLRANIEYFTNLIRSSEEIAASTAVKHYETVNQLYPLSTDDNNDICPTNR